MYEVCIVATWEDILWILTGKPRPTSLLETYLKGSMSPEREAWYKLVVTGKGRESRNVLINRLHTVSCLLLFHHCEDGWAKVILYMPIVVHRSPHVRPYI